MRSLLRRIRSRVAKAYVSEQIRRSQPFAAIRPLPPRAIQDDLPAPTVSAFDENRAFALLERQCAAGPRIPGTDGHANVHAMIVDELFTIADEVGVQEWMQRVPRSAGVGERVPMTNIFARISGTSELGTPVERLQPPLMLAAHWDTRPMADHDPDTALRSMPVPGASDGASGVAILLEVGRALAVERPERSVVLAFFDGEDLGYYYYGSRMYGRHAGRPELSKWRPERAIVVDMVGGRNVRCTAETTSMEAAPDLWTGIQESARVLGLSSHFDGPAGRVNDDHVMLIRAGIPSIVLIDYTYPFWHTTRDVPEQCTPASLGAIGKVLLHYIRSHARSGEVETGQDAISVESAPATGAS